MLKTPFETTFNRLQYSTRIKARQILHEIETSPEELARFCHHAARLTSARAELLCPIFGGMNSPEYLDLLRLYALRGEPQLREAALDALRAANPSARRKAVYALLSAPDEALRQEVCALLGAENTEEAGRQLIALLRQDAVSVQIAALEGLKSIPLPEAAADCERLLAHADKQVRLLAVQVLEAIETPLPATPILKLLKSDPELKVRLQVCRALARRQVATAAPALINLLNDAPRPPELRCEAARTLAHYQGRESAEALFLTGINLSAEPALRQVCRQSLLMQPQETLLDLCRFFLNSPDPVRRREAASVCGKVDSNIANALLSARLEVETDPLVTASLLEESGASGAIGAWDIAMEKLRSPEPMVAYLAAQTLARLLIPPKLKEFAALLEEHRDNYLCEVLLGRLASFARARGLSQEILGRVIPYLSHAYSNIAVLAAEAVSASTDDRAILAMLAALDPASPPEKQFALCRGLLASSDGSLLRLLGLAGADNLLKIAAILSRVEEVKQGECDAGYFTAVAAMAASEAPYARLCLTLAACLKPAGLCAALKSAEGRELFHLLEVWQALPENVQLSAPAPWRRLLSFPDKQLRLLALGALPPGELSRQIGILTEIALIDPVPEVAELARQRLRQTIAETSDAL